MVTIPHRIKNGKIVINFDPRVAATIPHTQEYIKNHKRFLVLPHHPTETKLLNNIGYSVDSPIRDSYDWCGITPFDHQIETAEMMTTNYRSYVLSGMGVGKTLASLFAIDYLIKCGDITKVLVVAPLSVVSGVWEAEVFKFMPHLSVSILHGTKKQRLRNLGVKADLYIINHDGVNVIKDELAKMKFDFLLIDELSSFRNARTRRWKVLKNLSNNIKYVHGLTGTPMVKAPTDAYGQVRMITPETITPYFKAFQQETMIQVSPFTWRPRQDALDTVYSVMQPAIRVTLDECSDIPETVYTTREVDMTADQLKVYKKMKNEFFALHDGKEINAVNAGVRMGKLLQIAAGVVYTETGTTVLENKERLTAVKDLIDQSEGKVIVFVPYRHQLQWLHDELKQDYSVEQVHGGVSKKERDEIFTLFKNSPVHPQVILAVPSTMSHGLNLTVATTIIWYAPTTNLETYEQANARIIRATQKKHTIIAHIESSPIEKRVYKVLQDRGNLQAALLSMYQHEVA